MERCISVRKKKTEMEKITNEENDKDHVERHTAESTIDCK